MEGLTKQTGTYCPTISKALQSTDWHILSNNMEGLTKQTGTYCLTIWKALQSTDWHIQSNNMEGLTKDRLAHNVQQYGRPYIAETGL